MHILDNGKLSIFGPATGDVEQQFTDNSNSAWDSPTETDRGMYACNLEKIQLGLFP